jgi:hypothetical protein
MAYYQVLLFYGVNKYGVQKYLRNCDITMGVRDIDVGH